MKNNKSLSARIKRRNKQGFLGEGTGLGYKMKNPGNYRDPEQNHKYDGRLDERITKEGIETIVKPSKNQNIINQAKRIGIVGKHAGSKPIHKLTNAIGSVASRMFWNDKAAEARLSR